MAEILFTAVAEYAERLLEVMRLTTGMSIGEVVAKLAI